MAGQSWFGIAVCRKRRSASHGGFWPACFVQPDTVLGIYLYSCVCSQAWLKASLHGVAVLQFHVWWLYDHVANLSSFPAFGVFTV